ncbi:MAG TPA: transposase [Methanosarcinaceae archaeon]|nr:transposase [Methanosarcinaceae archaeon]
MNKIFHNVKTGIQKKLSDFQNLLDKIKDRVHQYIPNLKTPVCKLIDAGELSEIENVAYSNFPGYKGDLHHLFLFYNWDVVNKIEEKYGIQTQDYNLVSVLKAHIFMCKRRIRTYTDLIEQLHENERFAEVCGFASNRILTRTIISRAADKFGIEVFREITTDMVKKCISLGLMKGRMVGVDGTLIKSNTSPYKNKETKQYTDTDAGLYVHGNYIKGIGFLAFKLTDIEYGLPMLVQCYKGSANENPLLRDILTDFYETYGFNP